MELAAPIIPVEETDKSDQYQVTPSIPPESPLLPPFVASQKNAEF